MERAALRLARLQSVRRVARLLKRLRVTKGRRILLGGRPDHVHHTSKTLKSRTAPRGHRGNIGDLDDLRISTWRGVALAPDGLVPQQLGWSHCRRRRTENAAYTSPHRKSSPMAMDSDFLDACVPRLMPPFRQELNAAWMTSHSWTHTT